MYNFTQEQIQDSVWGNPPAGGANPIFFQKFQKSHEIKEKDPPLELLKRYKSSFSVITLLLEKKINRYINVVINFNNVRSFLFFFFQYT